MNYFRPVSPQKETTATTKERPNFLAEVQAKVYYGLKTIAKKLENMDRQKV